MSLLMDALRKAEEAKRQAGEPAAAAKLAASDLTLAPLTDPPPASPLPELAPHFATVDAELSAAAGDTSAKRRVPTAASKSPDAALREAAERATAHNAFAAKAIPKSRRALWLTLAFCGLAALGLGAYFWWQLQSVGGGLRPAQAPAPAPTQAVAPASLAPPAPLVQPPPPPVAPTSVPTRAPSTAPNTAPETALFTPRERPPRPSPTARQETPASSLKLSKGTAQRPLERAYDNLQAGRLDEAQRDYEQALRSDGKSTDALLGLATIAARQGQTELAQGYYRRALETDPNDPTAQAGLINTRGQADPGVSESRLKSALASQPDAVALHFALGNLYARQARWSEAQQAYFLAYAGEPDNADFIFNLAVSLDHLHQTRLAAQYYQMALNTARGQNSSFDSKQVKQRIVELQP